MDPVLVEPISRMAKYESTKEKLRHITPINSKSGIRFNGNRKFKPILREMTRRTEPPMAHSRAVIYIISLLLLKNLLKLASKLQKNAATTTSMFPYMLEVNVKF